MITIICKHYSAKLIQRNADISGFATQADNGILSNPYNALSYFLLARRRLKKALSISLLCSANKPPCT
jgi:hypothetical protein